MPERGTAAPSGITALSLVAIVGSTVTFAVLDSAAKLAGQHLPAYEVAWFRYVTNFAMAAAIYNPWTSPSAWRFNHPWLQILRALLLTTMTLCNFIAFRYLQIAQTTSINFLAPLIITVLSVIFLREKIGYRRVIAILVGFGGVLLVTRPGLGGFHPAMTLVFAGTVASAVYSLVTRHLAIRESAGSMVLALAGVPTVLMAPGLPAVWQTPDSTSLWLLLVFVGAGGGFGHYLVMTAHRYASAATLAPYTYGQLIWAAFVGYLIFGDVPTIWTLAGGLVVGASGLYLLHREKVVGRERDRAGTTDDRS